MRVLIAYDASDNAAQAVALARAVSWPDGSTIRVVSVVEPLGPSLAGRWTGVADPTSHVAAAIKDHLETRIVDVVQALGHPRRQVESAIVHGRPASVIVDEAHDFGADLLIVGSRGHGAVASLVLGSVSGEVVDHAPCPVLVCREPTLERAVFGSDGSQAAELAEAILSRWPMFEEVPIRVVSVANVVLPWSSGVAPTMYQHVAKTYASERDRAKAEHQRIAVESANRLRAHGRSAEPIVRTGHAAAEIIAAAEEWAADLIVVGSRGRTGLASVLLGSVARNVVHGSRASVLIARSAVGVREQPT
jgi:nucleotide-binding universal stress UspA family protein